jgi:hypothetical protein
MSDSDEIALISDNTHQLTFLNPILYLLDGTRKDPRMKTPQALILPLP